MVTKENIVPRDTGVDAVTIVLIKTLNYIATGTQHSKSVRVRMTFYSEL